MQRLLSPRESQETSLTLYLPDGSRHCPRQDSSVGNNEERSKPRCLVTGAFPLESFDAGALVELVRDPENPARLMFLVWKDGHATVFYHIEFSGTIFVPPDPTSSSFPGLSLADGLVTCGQPAQLLAEICSTVSKFVTLRESELLVVASIVLASWFPDCFEAVPYLWVVGPLNSGKTKLLKILWCLCRRGVIAGDVRSGSLYKLTHGWNPTLIIDELEIGTSTELLRLLRTGSVAGVSAFRNGQRYSTYGMKVIASRQPLGDEALSSRGVAISLLPSDEDSAPL